MLNKIEKLSDLFRSRHGLEDQLVTVNSQIDLLLNSPEDAKQKIATKKSKKELIISENANGFISINTITKRSRKGNHPNQELIDDIKSLSQQGFTYTTITKKLNICSNTWQRHYKPIFFSGQTPKTEIKTEAVQPKKGLSRGWFAYTCKDCAKDFNSRDKKLDVICPWCKSIHIVDKEVI